MLPMFISCEEDTPIDYKAEFLAKLKTEVEKLPGDENVIETASLIGQNFTIEFADDVEIDAVKTAAEGFANTIGSLVTAGTLTLTEVGDEELDIKDSEVVDNLKSKLKTYLEDEENTEEGTATLNYKAQLTYRSKSISLTGTVTLNNIPPIGGGTD